MSNNENAKGTFRKFLDSFKRLIKRGNQEEELSAARENEGEDTEVVGESISPEESETFLIDKALESIQYYDRLDVMNIGEESSSEESLLPESDSNLSQEKEPAKSQTVSASHSLETSLSKTIDSRKTKGLKSTADSISLSLSLENKKTSSSLSER